MQNIQNLLAACNGFQWDAGNREKNWINHKGQMTEAEQAIVNRPIALSDDTKHSGREPRYKALGRTNSNRLLYVVFTIRDNEIRVISARDMDLEEKREYYEEAA